MLLTLTQAAELTGKSKSTLLRAIRKGRLSSSREENGAFLIDPAELHRVFPIASPDAPNDATVPHHATEPDAAVLSREVVLLREQLSREREFSRELLGLLQDEREERRKLTALLTHQAASKPEPVALHDASRPSLVEKLFGRRST
jgi:excisionase family DNA binding protein